MIEVHEAIHRWRQDKNRKKDSDPVPQIAEPLADQAWLLCFDEFHVTDIADAMILGRLFEALFRHGVVVVAPSTSPPHAPYNAGLQPAPSLPFARTSPAQGKRASLRHPHDEPRPITTNKP